MLRVASILALLVCCSCAPAQADTEAFSGTAAMPTGFAMFAGHPVLESFDLPEALALLAGAFVVLSSGSRRSQAM
jgi:hypothetical protein